MTRETLVFRAGAAVIGLHVADDRFLQPQPGTSATDHLVSGLVPLALLALAGWAFPRLPGTARGWLALVTGLLGGVTGVEAAYYWGQVGLSGDDFTGLLAFPAGAGLMVLGLVTLWRTRRTTGNLAWRYGRRALILLAAFVGLQFVLYPLGYAYVTTHVARAVVHEPRLGAAHEDVTFTTSDGLRLHGWYVPSRNGAAVIAFPGRKNPQPQTRMLVRHGYGVLLFDRRGEGRSEGDPNSWGWGGYRDVDAAVRFLQGRPDVDPDRIAGIGLSVGGEMMLEAAARNPGLAAVVSEGAGSRVVSEEVADVDGADKVRAGLFFGAMTAGVALHSGETPPTDLAELVGRIAPRPVFLVRAEHGEVGAKTPEYLAAAGAPKQSWTVPRGGHTDGIDAMPHEYERRVVGFLDEAVGR
jgi:hypothetical protein